MCATSLRLYESGPADEHFLNDVLEGLGQPEKTIPCMYMYDERGSKLFDAICRLDEYYPTRTELAIMERYTPEIGASIGDGSLLIEYGSGSSWKTRLLLDHLPNIAGYVPIDISREHLHATAKSIQQDYPALEVLPLCANYNQEFELPKPSARVLHRVVYFPGSTIGNLSHARAVHLLTRMAAVAGASGCIIIGVDLDKDRDVLRAAYSDREGVTAAFNMNLLQRINRELGADFDIRSFKHEASYNEKLMRMESHIVSLAEQTVTIGAHQFAFAEGERIHTENSHKYTLESFAELAAKAGCRVAQVWTDEHHLFSVQRLVPMSA